MKTSGLRTLGESLIGIFAPVVATSLYAFLGLATIVLIDLATFIFAFITLAFGVKIQVVKLLPKEQNNLYKQCLLGIRYLLSKKDIFSLILFMAFVNFIAAIYNISLSPMILSRSGNNDIQLIMTFSFLFCNSLLGIGQNYYIWTIAVFLGNILIPRLTANVEYIMRTKVPLELQGRAFSARNTLQYTSIPIGNILGGFFADKVFEPYMKEYTIVQGFLSKIVGNGDGSGIAVLFICIGIIGFAGCCIFRLNKSMRTLDNV